MNSAIVQYIALIEVLMPLITTLISEIPNTLTRTETVITRSIIDRRGRADPWD